MVALSWPIWIGVVIFCYYASARYSESETRLDYIVCIGSKSTLSSYWNSALFSAGISSSRMEVSRPVKSSVSMLFVSGHIQLLPSGTWLMNIWGFYSVFAFKRSFSVTTSGGFAGTWIITGSGKLRTGVFKCRAIVDLAFSCRDVSSGDLFPSTWS